MIVLLFRRRFTVWANSVEWKRIPGIFPECPSRDTNEANLTDFVPVRKKTPENSMNTTVSEYVERCCETSGYHWRTVRDEVPLVAITMCTSYTWCTFTRSSRNASNINRITCNFHNRKTCIHPTIGISYLYNFLHFIPLIRYINSDIWSNYYF